MEQPQKSQRPMQQQQPQMQQISIDELFKDLGEKGFALKMAHQMIAQLQQEKAKLEEELKKSKDKK